MKSICHLSFVATLLLSSNVSARWIPFGLRNLEWLPRDNEQGCPFTISSTGSFACPVGELPDGQIRVNGSESTATFYLNSGGITDSMGFGCIVTAPPTTQVQCNSGSAPDPNFSIDSGGNLLYKGSAQFFACPATDTEYNIYIDPDFGQIKCFPITLQASGCAAAAPTSTCPPAGTTTAWQTQTVQQTVGTTITVTVTSAAGCPTTAPAVVTPTPSVAPYLNTSSCGHCTETSSMW